MQSITIKLNDDLAQEMNSVMFPEYSTKTEFIREAIREHLRKVKIKKIHPELLAQFGKASSKNRISDRQIRNIVSKQLLKEYDLE